MTFCIASEDLDDRLKGHCCVLFLRLDDLLVTRNVILHHEGFAHEINELFKLQLKVPRIVFGSVDVKGLLLDRLNLADKLLVCPANRVQNSDPQRDLTWLKAILNASFDIVI